jgi:hypothetical protein
MLMKHVAVPFSYSVHVSTPIRGRNGRRGVLLSPLRLLLSRRPYPYALLPRDFTGCGCPRECRGQTCSARAISARATESARLHSVDPFHDWRTFALLGWVWAWL